MQGKGREGRNNEREGKKSYASGVGAAKDAVEVPQMESMSNCLNARNDFILDLCATIMLPRNTENKRFCFAVTTTYVIATAYLVDNYILQGKQVCCMLLCFSNDLIDSVSVYYIGLHNLVPRGVGAGKQVNNIQYFFPIQG